MWPYALNAGVVSIFYRISGIIFERTSEVGEVLIAEGD
jgi:Na+/H+-translocating membrane pyrophosphatase